MARAKDMFFLEANSWGEVDLAQMEIMLQSGESRDVAGGVGPWQQRTHA